MPHFALCGGKAGLEGITSECTLHVIQEGLGRARQLDPEDGKVYKAEMWTEGSNLKVRGYLGPFYKTQTWTRAQ